MAIVMRHDRTDQQIADEIKGLVRNLGLHAGTVVLGNRCCTEDELDAAVMYEVRRRRESNSTGMIVTTGQGASKAGVFLPPAPETDN